MIFVILDFQNIGLDILFVKIGWELAKLSMK